MSSQENTPEIQGEEDLRMIRRALVTVSDKSGVVDFCQQLVSMGIVIYPLCIRGKFLGYLRIHIVVGSAPLLLSHGVTNLVSVPFIRLIVSFKSSAI